MAQNMQNYRGNTQVAQAATPGQLTSFLKTIEKQVQIALPKHMNAERMTRLAVTAFSTNKALRDCDFTSIAGSVILAAQMGLEIGVAGQGYLVPYKGKATFVPGWQGIVDLVNRSGRATVWTGAVRDGDFFEYALGDRPFITHRPGDADEGDWTNITHVYAVGRVNGAEWPVIEVWSMKKVMKHRDKTNKVGSRHYSYEHPEMYARKIPLLQVAKYMPKTIELSTAIDADGRHEQGQAPAMDGSWVEVDPPEQAAEEPAPAPETSQPVNSESSERMSATAQTNGSAAQESPALARFRASIREAGTLQKLAAVIKTLPPDVKQTLQDEISAQQQTLQEIAAQGGGDTIE